MIFDIGVLLVLVVAEIATDTVASFLAKQLKIEFLFFTVKDKFVWFLL